MLLDALDDPEFARALARRLALPTFPVHGANPDTVMTSTGGSKTGYMPYFTGDANIEKSVVFEDAVNSRIGIGTSAPGAPLELSVAGTGVLSARISRVRSSSSWTIGEDTGVLEFYNTDMSGDGPGVRGFVKAVTEATAGNLWSLTFGTSYNNAAAAERMRIDSSGNVGIGTTIPGARLQVANKYVLAAESLRNPNLTGGTYWSAAGGMALANDVATYTHSGAGGTLTQTEANMAIAGKASRLYIFTYTISGASGVTTATITTAFALTAQTLVTNANGTYTLIFRSVADPGDFVINVTSSSGGFTIDTLSLKEVTAANDIAAGSVVLGGTLTKQATGGPEMLSFQDPVSDRVAFAGFVGSDTNFSFGASLRGFMEWGPGTADQDVALYRFVNGGGLQVQSFNNTHSDHAFAVQRPTTGADGADLFRVKTLSNIAEAAGEVALKSHGDASSWTGSDVFQATAAKKTTDGNAATLATLTLTDNRAYYITARVVAREGDSTSSSDRAFYLRAVLAFRQGASASIQGSVVNLATVESAQATGWDCTFGTNGNDVQVQVTGAANKDIYWVGAIEYQSASTDA